tara:strand:+ start:1831 stop:2037 length:207 start_codon:yes stop_codon:yes gene_type:complete
MEYKIMVNRLIKYYEGNMEAHLANVEDLLYNSVGVAEHPDKVATITEELKKVVEYRELLEEVKRHFLV